MRRVIVVEGPDGAGKSTLAQRLSKEMGRPLLHTGGPPASKELLLMKLEKIDAAQNNVILDRTPHISDPIYAKAEGRPLFLPVSSLHTRLQELNPIIIYCRLKSPREMYKHMYKGMDKEHKPQKHFAVVAENYLGIVQDYDTAMLKVQMTLGLDVLYYDWTQQSANMLSRELVGQS